MRKARLSAHTLHDYKYFQTIPLPVIQMLQYLTASHYGADTLQCFHSASGVQQHQLGSLFQSLLHKQHATMLLCESI